MFNIIINIINIIINKFEKKSLLLPKKTINLIWMIKLKIVVVVNKFEKQYYCYWEKTIKLIWMVKLKTIRTLKKNHGKKIRNQK